MTDQWAYDSGLDRLDVAVKAVWHLGVRGYWGILEDELGLTRRTLEPVIDQAQLTMERLRSERQVFAFLRSCPVVLDAAMELVRRYEELCGTDRVEFYRRLEELGWL